MAHGTTTFTYDAGAWHPTRDDLIVMNDDDIKAFNAGKIAVKPHRWRALIVGGKNVSDPSEN